MPDYILVILLLFIRIYSIEGIEGEWKNINYLFVVISFDFLV